MTKKVLLVFLALGLILSLTACPGLMPGEETVEDPTPTATPTPVVEEPTPVVEEPTPDPETPTEVPTLNQATEDYAYGALFMLSFMAASSTDSSIVKTVEDNTTTYTFTNTVFALTSQTGLVSGTMIDTKNDDDTGSSSFDLTFTNDLLLKTITAEFDYDVSVTPYTAEGIITINGIERPAQNFYDFLAESMNPEPTEEPIVTPTPDVEEPTPDPSEINVIGSWEFSQVVEEEGMQVVSTTLMTFDETTLTVMSTSVVENGLSEATVGTRYSYSITDSTMTMQLQAMYLSSNMVAYIPETYTNTGSDLSCDLVGDDWNSIDLYISEMVEFYMYSATISGATITEEEAYMMVFGESGIDPTEPMSTDISQSGDTLTFTDPETGEAQVFTRVIE